MLNLAEYKRRADRLADHLPWAALVAPGIVLNKDGSFMRSIAFRGPDLDSATEAELVAACARANNMLRRFGSGWALFFEAERVAAGGYPESRFPDAASWLADAERRAAFEDRERQHFESLFHLTLVWMPPADQADSAGRALIERPDAARGSRDWREAVARFETESLRAIDLMATFMPEVRALDDSETLTYLHRAISPHRHRVRIPATPMYLDALLADTPLTGGLEPMLGDSYLRTLTVLGFPSVSRPGIFDALNSQDFAYRWTTRFIALDKAEATAALTKLRRQWFAPPASTGRPSCLRASPTHRRPTHPPPLKEKRHENPCPPADARRRCPGAAAGRAVRRDAGVRQRKLFAKPAHRGAYTQADRSADPAAAERSADVVQHGQAFEAFRFSRDREAQGEPHARRRPDGAGRGNRLRRGSARRAHGGAVPEGFLRDHPFGERRQCQGAARNCDGVVPPHARGPGADQLGAGAAVGTVAAAAGTMVVAGGAGLAAARAGGGATLGAVRAGTSMGAAASTAYQLGQETSGSPSVGAGLGGVATALQGAAANAARRAGAGLGISEAAAAGRAAAWTAGNRTERAAPSSSPGNATSSDAAPAWAAGLKADQRRRAARQAAVHVIADGSRGGSGAAPDIAEKED